MLIDTHAHLDFPEFDHDRALLFKAMKQHGIKSAVIPAVDENNWQRVREVAHKYHCYYALGVHPWFIGKTEGDISQTLLLLTDEVKFNHHDSAFVAIGECGLDKLKKITMSLQVKALIGQILLANRFKLPLILHCVKAHNELLECLNQHPAISGGVMHGFSGSVEIAEKYIQLGFKIGIGGLLLNPNAKKLRKLVTCLPLTALVLETDSPSMSPQPNTRNTPLILPELVNEIACLRKNAIVLVSEQLYRNAAQLFEL